MELYAWQKECLKAWQNNNHKGTVQVITGAGKTYMALNAIILLKEKMPRPFRVKVVVPTVTLERQWVKAMQETLPDLIDEESQIGKFGNGQRDKNQDYMVYVINSARNNLSKHVIDDFKNGYDVFLICDECHHYSSAENRKIFEFVPYIKEYQSNVYSLGLSATPKMKYDVANIHEVLDKIIFTYDFNEAINDKTVVNYAVFNVSISFTAEEIQKYFDYSERLTKLLKQLYKTYPELKKLSSKFFEHLQELSAIEQKNNIQGIATRYLELLYARRSLCIFANNRYKCAEEIIKRLDSSEKIIIFNERIEQSETLYESLSRIYPNKVTLYHSQMTTQRKKDNLEAFRNNSSRILIACKSLDEGLDIPEASTAIVFFGQQI